MKVVVFYYQVLKVEIINKNQMWTRYSKILELQSTPIVL